MPGAWGAGLFESGQDNKVLSDIISDIFSQVFDPEIAKRFLAKGFEESAGEEMVARAHQALNDGLFTTLFEKYREAGPQYRIFGSKYYVVMLVAEAMKHGVHISDEQRAYAQSIVKSAGLYKEGTVQFEEAVEKFTNGVKHNFISPGVCTLLPGTFLLNHIAPRYYQDGVPTIDPDTAMIIQDEQREPRCNACQKPQMCLQPNEKFKRCSRCKNVYYCNSQCQKKAWRQHKTVCAEKATKDTHAEPHVDTAGHD